MAGRRSPASVLSNADNGQNRKGKWQLFMNTVGERVSLHDSHKDGRLREKEELSLRIANT